MVKAVRNIVIHGYYGAGNFGDDIILLSIVKSLRKLDPNVNITVLSRKVKPIPDSKSFKTVSRFDLKAVEGAIKKAHLLICGGGGIFHDYSGFDFNDHFGAKQKGINYYTLPIEMAYLMNKPVMLYAIGVGPLRNKMSIQHLKTVLNWVTLATVRDQQSADLLKIISPKSRIIVTADPAVNYAQSNTPLGFSMQGKTVGICLRHWFLLSDIESQEFKKSFSKITDYLIEKYGYKVMLFPYSQGSSDYNILKGVYDRVKNKSSVILKKNMSMTQTVSALKRLDLVIGMRLHSLIISLSNLVPAIGIAYDGKVSSFMNVVGLENYSIQIKDVKFSTLKSKVDSLILYKSSYESKLNKNISQLKAKEKQNASYALNILNGVK